MKVAVFNLGCKVNQYECDSLVRLLTDGGYEAVEGLQYADVYILNTCAVTNEAERKSRQAVTRIRKLNPEARIFVCGCASQHDAAQFERLDNVVCVFGTAHKAALALLDESQKSDFLTPVSYEDDMTALGSRTRAYVKIQDGCNNFCTYCIVPYLRGRSRSRSIDSIRDEVIEAMGRAEEVVLTGIDVSSYHTEQGGFEALFDALSDLDVAIRLSSLEVGLITRDFLDATTRLRRFCPHFHLSLQSGSNATLAAMNRHYTTDRYMQAVELIRSYYPDAAITTDVIVGFVRETDEDFEESLRFCDSVGFANIHVFPYSPRSGTVAYKWGSLPANVVEERARRMGEVKTRSIAAFLNANLGRQNTVLIEEVSDGYSYGYSANYIRVRVPGELTIGRRYPVRFRSVEGDIMIAEIDN